MSQQKVDARKAAKKNRKETIAREKRNAMITKVTSSIVALAICCGLGYSIYLKAIPEKEVNANAFTELTATDNYGILNPSIPEAE